MPYNEAIVHESVRHFMGRTFGVPHRALRNTTLAGYNIPEVNNCIYILFVEHFFKTHLINLN